MAAAGPIHAPAVDAFANPLAASAMTPYPAPAAAVLNAAGFGRAREEIGRWPGYAVTPLRALPALAGSLGIASLFYKDERGRFGLRSFKALGGAYAVLRVLQQRLAEQGIEASGAELLAGAHRSRTADITVTCATDGNHGRSVAWGAQRFGCRCVIVVHETVSEGRCEAIRAYGATVERVPGNYDDSVRHADAQARAHGWTVVSDTSYPGYTEIPTDVMHGYGVLGHEMADALGDTPPTHVFLPAGVGGLAAAVAAVFWLRWGERRPRVIVVEPRTADCHLRSAMAGEPTVVGGSLETVMAGLACGEVSPLAWQVVSRAAQAFVAIDDDPIGPAMRRLAEPCGDDPAIVAGETGVAGLAALILALDHPGVTALLALGPDSRVLLIGSEGDTDPALYRDLTGLSPAAP
ncbi:MAG: diaminopropionate ammonia-lyase [Burkholderiaceae bacterium]